MNQLIFKHPQSSAVHNQWGSCLGNLINYDMRLSLSAITLSRGLAASSTSVFEFIDRPSWFTSARLLPDNCQFIRKRPMERQQFRCPKRSSSPEDVRPTKFVRSRPHPIISHVMLLNRTRAVSSNKSFSPFQRFRWRKRPQPRAPDRTVRRTIRKAASGNKSSNPSWFKTQSDASPSFDYFLIFAPAPIKLIIVFRDWHYCCCCFARLIKAQQWEFNSSRRWPRKNEKNWSTKESR